jgi:hypothetical protein
MRSIRLALPGACLLLTACVTSEVKPLPKMHAVQATTQIPDSELLDVGIRVFDPNIPADIKDDPEALAKQRIYPEVRRAESVYLPNELRETLEGSGQWGAVRVVPDPVEFVDVLVTGRILESTGAELSLAITVTDATGRVWIKDKTYSSPADIGSYKSDAALRQRDPFQNVYAQIANDMLAARQTLSAQGLRDIRRVTELRFAADLAPEAMQGYLAPGKNGQLVVERLPAVGDPVMTRVERIRERDAGVVDTVNGYYANFSEQIADSYGSYRRVSEEEIEKEDRAMASARMRMALGAAAVLASILVPSSCGAGDYTCQNVVNAARAAGTIGGVAGVMSGIKKYEDAKASAEALNQVADTFEAEITTQVVEVEGRTLKLTGSAEQQFTEWRALLRQIWLEETGGAATPPPTAAAPKSTASRAE